MLQQSLPGPAETVVWLHIARRGEGGVGVGNSTSWFHFQAGGSCDVT